MDENKLSVDKREPSPDIYDEFDQKSFDADVDRFFNILFERMEKKEISPEEAERFFPEKVKLKCG
jgi:hypothetical protein